MNQSSTQHTEQNYLDRRSLPETLLLTQQERFQHVTTSVNQILQKHQERCTPPHLIARELGEFLVKYSQVAGDERVMDTLVNNFYQLGQYVALITSSLGINLLPEEENIWLGQVRGYPWQAEGERFEFSDFFSNSLSIADCTENEKLRLYRSYLCGKCAGMASALTNGSYFFKN